MSVICSVFLTSPTRRTRSGTLAPTLGTLTRSGMGVPTRNCCPTAKITLWVIEVLKPPHPDKVGSFLRKFPTEKEFPTVIKLTTISLYNLYQNKIFNESPFFIFRLTRTSTKTRKTAFTTIQFHNYINKNRGTETKIQLPLKRFPALPISSLICSGLVSRSCAVVV